MGEKKIAIIGAGPAVIAAAIQLKRFGFSPDLFEKDIVGGLLWNANLVENYPGFPGGVSGPDLIQLMKKQLDQFSIDVINSEIKNIKWLEDKYELSYSEGLRKYDYIIVASGTKPIIANEMINYQSLMHVNHDIKKLLDSNGKIVIIVGSGDAAFDQAINLAQSNDIIIINRDRNCKCLPILAGNVFSNPRIDYIDETTIRNVEQINDLGGTDTRIKITLQRRKDTRLIECDELVFAVGRAPQLDYLENNIRDSGIFYAGDVRNGKFRQTSIAVGEGVMAAMKIENLINEEKNENHC